MSENLKKQRQTKKAIRTETTGTSSQLYSLKNKPSELSFPKMYEMTENDLHNLVKYENKIKLKANWKSLPKGTDLFEVDS